MKFNPNQQCIFSVYYLQIRLYNIASINAYILMFLQYKY